MSDTSIDWNLRSGGGAGTKHLPGLDGLRGIAVLMVTAYHARPEWFPGGFVGVDIFFVLSGFLITDIVFSRMAAGKFSFLEFYKRRAARILPALFLLLAVFAALEIFVRQYTWPPHRFWPAWWHSLTFTMNFYFYGQNAGAPFSHLWSLATEAQFYIIMPLLVVTARRLGILRGFFALCVVLTVGWFSFRGYVWSSGNHQLAPVMNLIALNRTEGFMLGALTAYGLRLFPHVMTALARPAFIVPPLVIAVCLVSDKHMQLGLAWGCSIAMLATVSFICAAVTRPQNLAVRALEWRPLRWIGEISYGLYLWHVPLFLLIRQKGPLDARALSISLALTLLLSAASYHFLERRFLVKKTKPAGA